MSVSHEFFEDVVSSNPIVVFTHRQWPSSEQLLRQFRNDGVAAHEVRVDASHALHGSKGEPQLLRELAKATGKSDVNDAMVFIAGNFVNDVNKISDLRGACAAAGAKLFPVQEPHIHHAGLGPWQAERGD